MKKLLALCVGVSLILTLCGLVFAASQDAQKGKPPAEIRLSGRVQGISKARSEFQMRVGNSVRMVGWTPETRWTYRNEPDSIDSLKEGIRVICLGKFEGVKLIATRVDLREK